uniref:G_PROTEIN_RECEP_F1_2 domain-containing protein n=1 Tax=Caenorhabditis tropicalis TaxID=1561998 RepID=A0A1I7TND6_9PELO
MQITILRNIAAKRADFVDQPPQPHPTPSFAAPIRIVWIIIQIVPVGRIVVIVLAHSTVMRPSLQTVLRRAHFVKQLFRNFNLFFQISFDLMF